jgi:Transposase IS66 family
MAITKRSISGLEKKPRSGRACAGRQICRSHAALSSSANLCTPRHHARSLHPGGLGRPRRFRAAAGPVVGPCGRRTGRAPPGVAYVYAPDRTHARPAEHLAGFSGILQVDGYGAYAELAQRGDVAVARHPMGRIDELLPFAYVPAAEKALSRPLSGDGRLSAAPLSRRAFRSVQPRFGPQSLPMRGGEGRHRGARIAASLTPAYVPTACR